MATDTSPNNLIGDVRQVMSSAEELLGATASQGGDKIADIRERAERALRAAREKLEDFEDTVAEQARAARDAGERSIREYPWTAVGVSAGIGLVIGLLIGRR